jgi:hypothetical protein
VGTVAVAGQQFGMFAKATDHTERQEQIYYGQCCNQHDCRDQKRHVISLLVLVEGPGSRKCGAVFASTAKRTMQLPSRPTIACPRHLQNGAARQLGRTIQRHKDAAQARRFAPISS